MSLHRLLASISSALSFGASIAGWPNIIDKARSKQSIKYSTYFNKMSFIVKAGGMAGGMADVVCRLCQ